MILRLSIINTFIIILSNLGLTQNNITIVDERAEFPGGNMEMYKYLGDNISYPASLDSIGIQGKVYLKFAIDTTGKVVDLEILKSPHKLLSEEVLRAFKAMPKWNPSISKGKKVKEFFTMPITIELK